MFLKSVELYGFKSFADKTRLEFSSGTTSLLGPNGCGKSNIVDAIKWVLGEQSTKTLRAGKMEDIIFNGTETRKPLNVAEVSLVVNNEDGMLPIEHTEVEIKRRIYRSGESEFFINKNQVRLRDVRELFYDTGVGKSAYSILEQGKIDQILSHKPEDRRYIFEEAAGITRYKSRSLEASRKLQRTEENIEQVETLFKEIKRQYESRKTQAAKVRRYRELDSELSLIEVDVQFATIKNYQALAQAKQQELQELENSYEALKLQSAELRDFLEEQQTEVRSHVENRINMQSRTQHIEGQLNGKHEQIALLQQRYADFLHDKDESLQRANTLTARLEQYQEDLEDQQDVKEALEASIAEVHTNIKQQEELTVSTASSLTQRHLRIAELEKEIIEEQEKQQKLSTDLQILTDELVKELDQRLSDSGYSTANRKKAEKEFLERIEHVKQRLLKQSDYFHQLSDAVSSGALELEAVVQTWQTFLKKTSAAVDELKGAFGEYGKTLPSFIDELLAPEGIMSRKHALDQQLSDSHATVAANRQSIEILRAESNELQNLLDQYKEHVVQLRILASEYTAKRDSATQLMHSISKQMTELEYQRQDAAKETQFATERVEEATTQLAEAKEQQSQLENEKQELAQQLSAIIELIENENRRLNNQRDELNTLYEQQSERRNAVDKLTFHLESLDTQVQQVYTTYYQTYGKSLHEHQDRLDQEIEEIEMLCDKRDTIKKQIQGMGYINHMAEEEFAEIKERHDFLHQQLSDLYKAKDDLQTVIEEIRLRSEKLFIESYEAIRQNFQQMFHRMFGGGRAELRLLDPENALESGIDILAQPPGKKLDRLAPLSGGEKSLTAVALLFATYKVKPSPFCILDEIDAALDDRNIGNFLTVLEEFAQTSQFIIITHNKHTVLGSKTLLGVTMEEKGISKAISYRMGWEAQLEADSES